MFNTGCFIIKDDEVITKKNIERANLSKFENWKMDKDLRSCASLLVMAEQLYNYIETYTLLLHITTQQGQSSITMKIKYRNFHTNASSK